MSRKEMADLVGVTRQCLSMIECGRRSGSLSTLIKIAGALGVGLDDLVTGKVTARRGGRK